MTYRYRYQQRSAAGPGAQRGMYGGSFVRTGDAQQAQIQALMDQLAALTGITPGGGGGTGGYDAGTGEPLTTPKPVAPAARGAVTPLTEKPTTGVAAPAPANPTMPQLPSGAVIIGRTADGKWVVRMANGSVGLLNPDGSIANVGAPPPATGGTGGNAVTPPPAAPPAVPPPGTAGAPGFDPNAPVPQPGPTGPAAPGDFVPPPDASSGYVAPVGGDPLAPAGAPGPLGPAGPAPTSLALTPAPQPQGPGSVTGALLAGQGPDSPQMQALLTKQQPAAPITPTPAPTNYPGEPTMNPTPAPTASVMPEIFRPPRPVNDVAPATSVPPPPDFSTVLNTLGAMPPPTPTMPPEYGVQLPPVVDPYWDPWATGPR